MLIPSYEISSSSFVEVINIYTIEKGFDVLDVAVNASCPRLKEECAKIASSQEWQEVRV